MKIFFFIIMTHVIGIIYIYLVRCKTSYGPRSVKYKGSNLWNQLPNDPKVIASLNSYKRKLKFILATSHI